jgi:hypothetical protein
MRFFGGSLLLLSILTLASSNAARHKLPSGDLGARVFHSINAFASSDSCSGIFGGSSQGPSPETHPRFQAVLDRFTELLNGKGQYMVVAACTQPDVKDPNLQAILKPYTEYASAKKLRLQDCFYFDEKTNLTGRVIMLNPNADRLARWTVSACSATHEGTTDRCLMSVINNLWCPSNAQFPITGTVTEDGSPCGVNGPVLFAFRDGVTVRLKSLAPPHGRTCTQRKLSKHELTAVLSEQALRAAVWARLANANDGIMSMTGIASGKLSHAPKAGKIPYLETSRTAYLDALGSDEYLFLSSWARSAESAGFFDRFSNIPFGAKNQCNCFNADTPGKIKSRCK